MTPTVLHHLEGLFARCPALVVQRDTLLAAYHILCECFDRDGTLFTGGNGGSCSDADHIVGELQKGYLRSRRIPAAEAAQLEILAESRGKRLGVALQGGLRAVSLCAHTSLLTAVCNDIGGEYMLAQGLYALGRSGDVLLAISTSGNALNVLLACDVARLKGIPIIGLTGSDGGDLGGVADVTIRVPQQETFLVQEYHLPVYHTLCAMLEARYFS